MFLRSRLEREKYGWLKKKIFDLWGCLEREPSSLNDLARKVSIM